MGTLLVGLVFIALVAGACFLVWQDASNQTMATPSPSATTGIPVSPGAPSPGTSDEPTSTPNRSSAPASTPVPRAPEVTDAMARVTTLVNSLGPDVGHYGSGIVVDASGIVVTNYHVLDETNEIKVTSWDGVTHEATVLGRNIWEDIAVLKVHDWTPDAVARPDPDGVVVGERAMSVGNGGGEQTFRSAWGPVSEPAWRITKESAFGVGDQTLYPMISYEQEIIAGYSGGPTFDDDGEVIGMTTVSSFPQDPDKFTGAIPFSKVTQVANDVLAGREAGHVRIGPRSDVGLDFTADDRVVSHVDNGSGAQAAGIVAGSVINSIDGTGLQSSQDLLGEVETREPGTSVTIGWTDPNGAQHSATFNLAEKTLN